MGDLEERAPTPAAPRHDLATVVAVAVVAYALDNVLHEAVGHGGATLLVGGTPRVLSSMHFAGDARGLPEASGRWIAAGGTIVNAVAGAVALPFLRRATGATRFFLWLFATVSFLQATGYLLYSGLAGIGDWARVVDGWSPALLWRGLLAVVGGALYVVAVTRSMRGLSRFVGPRRAADGFRLALVAYATGGVLYAVSGLANPLGLEILVVSGLAASLGGTSGLAWGPSMLGDPSFARAEAPFVVARSVPWLAAGAIAAAVFVAVLGPGVRLG